MAVMKARIGQALAVGNEGAGTVVATGSSELAKSLDGKVVAAMGGGMYGQYRCVDASVCLPLLEGHLRHIPFQGTALLLSYKA